MVDLEDRIFLTGNQLYAKAFYLADDMWAKGVRPTHVLSALGGGPIGALAAQELFTFRLQQSDPTSEVQHGFLDLTALDASIRDSEIGEAARVLVVDDVAHTGHVMRTIRDALERTGADVTTAVVYARSEDTRINFVGHHIDQEIVLPHQLRVKEGDQLRPLTNEEAGKVRPALFEDMGRIARERLKKFAYHCQPDGENANVTVFEFRDADQLYDMAFHLGRKIVGSGSGERYKPDHVLSIWRGGAPVGLAVYEYLRWRGINVPHSHVVKAESYNKQENGDLHISGLDRVLPQIQEGSDVLVVDELMDTGATLGVIKYILSKKVGKTGSVRLAVLDWKPGNNVLPKLIQEHHVPFTRPDYALFQADGRWLVGPHEINDGVPLPLLKQYKHSDIAKYL